MLQVKFTKANYVIDTRNIGYNGTTTTAPSEISTPEPSSGTATEYGLGILGDNPYRFQ